MNIFKKIIATLTSRENPFSSGYSGDPRTDLLTRGPVKFESAKDKFQKHEREASELSLERKETIQAQRAPQKIETNTEK